LPTFLKRIIVGLVAGISIGSIVMSIALAMGGDVTRLSGIEVLGLALLLGGGTGAPVGMIVALLSSLVTYRSGWAWEWALVGASGAALTIVALGRIQTPAALVLLVIATGTSVVVERITALLFHDQPYDDSITRETLIMYLAAIGLIAASYFALLHGLLLGVD
jgi:hypothetical protein